jgi:segregation and condensation protein B
MSVDSQELLAAVEAVIFVASEPVTLKRFQQAFPDESAESLEAALTRLAELYHDEGRGLALDRVAGGWRLVTRPAVHAHVQRFVEQEKAERLSLRTLETLSVIAYKQPVTSAEIQEIRGVDPSGTVRTLLDKGLVKIAGRKKVVGRPFVYGTTKQFLRTFGLNELSELPSLKELEDFATDIPTTDPRDVEPPEEEGVEEKGVEETAPAAEPAEEHQSVDADEMLAEAQAAEREDEPDDEHGSEV